MSIVIERQLGKPQQHQRKVRKQLIKWLTTGDKQLSKDDVVYDIIGIRSRYILLRHVTEFIWLHFSNKRWKFTDNCIIVNKKQRWKKLC